MILEAFWVGYNVWAGLCHLYFPCPCLRLSLMPAWVYCRASCVVRVSVALVVMWQSAILFGDLFPVWFGRLALFSYDFWVGDLIRNSVWDPNILAIRQQTRKGSEMVSDIFETQFYCMDQMLWPFHVFHFWTTAVKKAGVLNLQLCCLTVFCCEWQSFAFVWQSGGWGTTQIVGYKLLLTF